MPDLNRMLADIQKNKDDVKDSLQKLLFQYDAMLREGNKVLIDERMKTGSTEGLEDFIRLMHLIKRNRDVMGSLVRGVKGIRSMDGFKFIEEPELAAPMPKKPPVGSVEIPELPAEIGDK